MPHTSRAECIDKMGMPMSRVRMPVRAAMEGPIVEPHATLLRPTNNCDGTPACSQARDQAAAPIASVG